MRLIQFKFKGMDTFVPIDHIYKFQKEGDGTEIRCSDGTTYSLKIGYRELFQKIFDGSNSGIIETDKD